jgi:hypothetical protein
MRRRLLSVSVFAALLVGSTPALGQSEADDERGWTPKRYSQSELIDFGGRDASPLSLPWEAVRIEQVTNYGRVDFRHIVEANFGDVRNYLEETYKQQEPALQLAPDTAPPGATRDLYVHGTASQGARINYTLGNGDLRRTFIIQVSAADDEERTSIVFQNMSVRQLFSAGLPRLGPLKPVDAGPIRVGR